MVSGRDWSFLGYWLATHGIPSDIGESMTREYDPDPWRPEPDVESVTVTLDRRGAERLVEILTRESA